MLGIPPASIKIPSRDIEDSSSVRLFLISIPTTLSSPIILTGEYPSITFIFGNLFNLETKISEARILLRTNKYTCLDIEAISIAA